MPKPRTALAAAALLLAPGCILFVHDDVGPACTFQGESFPCGSCVAHSCQKEVNDCCGQPSCSGEMNDLDSCAGEDDIVSCNSLLTATGGAAGNLAACIAAQCNYCNLGGVQTDAGNIFESGFPSSGVVCGMGQGGMGCSCIVTPGTNTTTCNSTSGSVPTICCAQPGYPTTQSSACTCLPYECTVNGSSFCECLATANLGSQSSCTNTSCCLASSPPGTCYCNSTMSGCSPSDTPVSMCDISQAQCPSGYNPVSGCTP